MLTKKDLVDTAIRKALAGIKPDPKGSCPDDNLVAAYLEGGLSSPERLYFEDHASNCVNCQELVALSTRLLDAENTHDLPAKTSPRRVRSVLFRFPVPALALLLVAVAIGIIFREEKDSLKQPAKSAPTLSASIDQAKSAEAPKLNQAPPRAAPELEAGGKTKERSDKSGQRYAEEKPASSPPVLETKSTILKDADDFRTREQRNESAAVGPKLKKDESFAVPASRTGALDVQTLPVGQAGGEVSLKNAIAGLSQQRRQQEGDSNKAAQSADRVTIVGGNLQRRVGKRVFHLSSGYWIDAQCSEHPDSDIVEINAESPEYAEIRRESPEIEELRTSGVPILVHWKSKNYVIRQ